MGFEPEKENPEKESKKKKPIVYTAVDMPPEWKKIMHPRPVVEDESVDPTQRVVECCVCDELTTTFHQLGKWIRCLECSSRGLWPS